MARVWLITGASRGIGSAVAAAAANDGARLVLVARSPAVDEVAGRLALDGVEVLAVRADLTERGATDEVVGLTLERFGALDVVVNNAAVHRGGRVEQLADEDVDAVLSVGLVAPLGICRAAVPHLERGGSIINIGSPVGLRGSAGDAAYGSAKAGLVGLTQALAVELAPSGVTVNLVVPGFVATDMTDALSDRRRAQILARIPLGRPGQPCDVAQVVVWVSRSAYMTGAVVPVDGGLLAAL